MDYLSNLSKKTITIILPIYNGERFIGRSIYKVLRSLHEYDKRNNFLWEIIIVDDGSVDKTRDVLPVVVINELSELKDTIDFKISFKILSYSKNMGKGFAFLTGVKRSSGDIIFIHDADLDIPIEQLFFVLDIFIKLYDKVDVIVTSKWHPLSKVESSKLRRLLSRSFRFIVRSIFHFNVNDTQTGSKAFKREVLDVIIDKVKTKRYAFDVELLYLISCNGFRLIEVPSIFPIKLKSFFSFREIVRMLLDLIFVLIRYKLLNDCKKRGI